MKRDEFSLKTKQAAAERAAGYCEECSRPFKAYEKRHYDHIIPCAIGGTNEIGNCAVLCIPCHKNKTGTADIPRIAKAKRNYRKSNHIKKPSKFRGWRKFNGTLVRRGDQ